MAAIGKLPAGDRERLRQREVDNPVLSPIPIDGKVQAKNKKDSNLRVEVDDLVPAREVSPEVLAEESFAKMLRRERRRSDRSKSPFVLMVLELADGLSGPERERNFNQMLLALSGSTRETDLIGWRRAGESIGVIFTELGRSAKRSVTKTLSDKVRRALGNVIPPDERNTIVLSCHFYPDEPGAKDPPALALFPERERNRESKKVALSLKRAMDIVGSLAALTLLSPVFLAVAVLVKLTSKGPVLFRQERIGRFGERFTFLKFRSMYDKNDPSIHQDYVKQLISGSAGAKQENGRQDSPFKLTADPRVTPVGRFIRKSSLDEFPQFLNVLRGEMSLVGPRPPIPYEFANYDVWHRRRLFEVKPGITGLWQVRGRSRTTFDDMVRLDLKYASSWSLWLDVKILLETPKAVVSGVGAC